MSFESARAEVASNLKPLILCLLLAITPSAVTGDLSAFAASGVHWRTRPQPASHGQVVFVMSQPDWSLDAAPTLNFHIVAACDYRCEFCYAPFIAARREALLKPDEILRILREFKRRGGTRVRFAGGEPTLHPRFTEILQGAVALGLVTSVVTHGRHIDVARHLPWLRHIAISIDSASEETCNELGRQLKGQSRGHVAHVEQLCAEVHAWNRVRPPDRRVHLAFNIVVTSVNARENPTEFIRRCRPEKVKLLQMLPVAGENDHARHLSCADADFAAYCARLMPLHSEGLQIVPETNEDMDGSYMMVDPRGRFFQRREGRYVYSDPILQVGFDYAFAQVGGYRRDRFVARGAAYDPGRVPDGNRPYWIAVEGLDGSGKSTVVRALAENLGAAIVTNPPDRTAAGRPAADAMPEPERRAWYRQANYVAAGDAQRILESGRPVIMDRSFASTAAFASATAGDVAVPDDWPADLARPDAIVLLDVPEEVRAKRLMARGMPQTAEEQRLAADGDFRGRVLAGLRNLGARVVDASPPVPVIVSEMFKSVDAQ